MAEEEEEMEEEMEEEVERMEERLAALETLVERIVQELPDIMRTIAEVSAQASNAASTNQLALIKKKSEFARNKVEQLAREMRENFIVTTMGLSQERVRQTRYIPMRLYLAEDDPELVSVLEKATTNFGMALGFFPASEYGAEKGSWFKRWIGRSKEALTSDETKTALKKGKHAIDLSARQKTQSEVNVANAEAAATYIKATENVPNAIAQFGSLLIVKLTDDAGCPSVFTKELTIHEMEFIENNPAVTRTPELILDKLSTLKIDDETTVRIGAE